jgi:branched-chain amino acid transport system ATP-binding protein
VSALRVEGLVGRYGRVRVLHDVSFAVEHGEAICLLGANGAGKTSTLRAISGLLAAQGSIAFDGRELLALRPDRIARLGIAHVPQGRGIFAGLTVEENLRLGARLQSPGASLEPAWDLFGFMYERRGQRAGTLSGGEQQMLALARALLGRPRLLLLDEPSLGLAPKVVRELFEVLARVRGEQGLSMLLVEQNAELALQLVDRAFVLEGGRVALSGDATIVGTDERTRQAYLGY